MKFQHPLSHIPVPPNDKPDDLHSMVVLWQSPSTRSAALDLADLNRKSAQTKHIDLNARKK